MYVRTFGDDSPLEVDPGYLMKHFHFAFHDLNARYRLGHRGTAATKYDVFSVLLLKI